MYFKNKFINLLKIAICVLLATNAVQAQDQVLQRKATINITNADMSAALDAIAESYDITFSYDKSILPNTRINEQHSNIALKKILDNILTDNSLEYDVVNTTIVIYQSSTAALPRHTLSGTIVDAANKESLIGVSVFDSEVAYGAVSNSYGFYSLSLPEGKYEIVFSYLGYERVKKQVVLTKDIVLNAEMNELGAAFDQVVITDEVLRKEEHVSSTDIGNVKLGIKSIKKIPALFGEVDLIKAIQLLPGVQSSGEGGSGFHVRGGSIDQNLVILDEAPIYNSAHLGGLFSTFNPDVVKEVKFFKGGFPAYYGGRLSSVVDVRMREGNKTRFTANGGIGTIMSRLTLEAPLGSKGSFVLAGRRNYLDYLIKGVRKARAKSNSSSNADFDLYFYDINAKANYQLGENDRVFFSMYTGRDVFGFDLPDAGLNSNIEWGNVTSSARWNHLYSPKLFSNITYTYSKYDYFISFDLEAIRIDWKSKLAEHNIKADFVSYMSPTNTLRFGARGIYYNLLPGDINAFNKDRRTEGVEIDRQRSLELAAYVDNEWEINSKFKVDAGLRFSSFLNTGSRSAVTLDEEYNVTDTVELSGVHKTYWNLEPRLKMRYQLDETSSLKASYSRNSQYLQLASNSNYASPFDIWFSSSRNIKPQIADQISLGYFKSLDKGKYLLSVELFNKWFRNAIDFKDHANLLLNRYLETEIRTGKGRAYGAEFQIKKDVGKLSGWLGYTYSRAKRNIAQINNGQWYNARYDVPHVVNLVMSYDLNDRWSIGTNFNYSTGAAVTLPTGGYDFMGTKIPIYSERNDARLPDYHRLDLSFTYNPKKNENRKFKTEWVFSIYNVYARRNAFNIKFSDEKSTNGELLAEKVSLFSLVPAITFNFKY